MFVYFVFISGLLYDDGNQTAILYRNNTVLYNGTTHSNQSVLV